MKKEQIIKVSVTGVFCALAFIMTAVLRFKVAHLSFDLKDTIIAIVSLMYGPLYGIICAAIVAFLEFFTVSDTGFYGLIMNFLSSATFTLLVGIVYKYKRTFSGAIIGVCLSVVGVCVVMSLANILITPLYIPTVDSKAVIAMIPTLLLPFNFCKALINAAATVAIYKPVRGVLKKARVVTSSENTTVANQYKSIIVFIVAAVIIAVTVFLLIKVMGGNISFF
ncbi:MAG: ECF transporter S component [Clostridia bacterium]|nr:ECF transporter S component [Clostridia bacterium]